MVWILLILNTCLIYKISFQTIGLKITMYYLETRGMKMEYDVSKINLARL